VRDFNESFAWLTTYALRGGVGRPKLGVLLFQIAQLAHELIEFCISDLRLVEDVIQIFVMFYLLAQFLGALHEGL
jgi:hypothetical protein